MRRALIVCSSFCAISLATEPCAAKSVTLQTVDLNDKAMSTEGGEATLYRVSTGKSVYCRIEAIHYGETGKAIYGFAFNPRLFSAVRREYDYEQPIYIDPGARQTLTSTETLETKEGSATLPAAFREYRSFFDARNLSRCLRH
jgi:hypothetical protein